MRRSRLAYLTGYVLLSTAFCWPLLRQPFAYGTGDWDQHLFYYASVLRNAAYGQFPFWNPWYCGGNVLWQNPQVSLISPVYALALVMPLALAMKLNILAHHILGFLGMHLVLRRVVGLRSPFVVVYAASLFVFSGAIALHLEAGHSDFLSMFWLPALVYCFWRAAAGHTKHAVAGAAIVAVSILNGGPHMVPIAAVLLGSLGLGAMVFGRAVKPLLLAVVIVALGCLYAAPKLVPSYLLLGSADFHDTRPVKHPDRMSLEMLQHALWDASQGSATRLNRNVQLYGWQEYGNYLGWFGGGLILISAAWILLFRHRREHWLAAAAALTVVVALILTAGEFGAFAPASLMTHLPFFSRFRIPSRHILLVPLAGAVCVAYAARAAESARQLTWLRRPIQILCVVAVCQLVLVNRTHLGQVFILPAGAGDDGSLLFQRQTPTNAPRDVPRLGAPERVLYTNMLGSMLTGISPLDCWEPLQVRKVAAPGAATVFGEGSVTILSSSFSPNRVAASVSVSTEPARIVLNQNFAEGWSASPASIERDPGSGRPSVLLPSGYTGPVEFRFVPPGLWMGTGLAVLAIAFSFLIWRTSRPPIVQADRTMESRR